MANELGRVYSGDLQTATAGMMESRGPRLNAAAISSAMKERLGFVGRISISREERRAAREQMKHVLAHELRMQTEAFRHRTSLQLSALKGEDLVAYKLKMDQIEKFLLSQEAVMTRDLNDMVDHFETIYTDQMLSSIDKLTAELDSGRYPKAVYDDRVRRVMERYNGAMDKCTRDMDTILSKHNSEVMRALRDLPPESLPDS
jgi:hypothetical protein